jgi:hypothetical protein
MNSPNITELEHRLSPHFTVAELSVSNTGARAGLRNTPVGDALTNLSRLANTLEQVRALLYGAPILVSSGYRSPAINALIGGSPSSAHMRGLAADFIAPKFGRPKAIAETIRGSSIQFDQLIFEGTWVHLGLAEKAAVPRRQVLTAVFGGAGRKTRYLVGIA